MKHFKKLVETPSLGAITYQAFALRNELYRISDEEYPSQACKIRDVFLSIVEYVLDELEALYVPENPLIPLNDEDFGRTFKLAEILQEIFSYIRYLRASSPHLSPPAIQLALTQLTDLYFPKEKNGDPVCLIRPQWKYNFVYVPITHKLGKYITMGALNPDGKLSIKNSRDILPALWQLRLEKLTKQKPDIKRIESPKQLAILSFPGLDTHDTLLYPILGHELGHFIDFSFEPFLHLRSEVRNSAEIDLKSVMAVLENSPLKANAIDIRTDLVKRTYICLREILADLLAARMLGFAFFCAQSEFLKTLATWPQAIVEPGGYPGIKFRLEVVFNHIFRTKKESNPLSFLKKYAAEKPEISKPLIKYIEEWSKRLKVESSASPQKATAEQRKLAKLIENVVRKSLPTLEKIVVEVISDEKCARLSEHFFGRVERLKRDLPPSSSPEIPNSFSEIMSAAWAYQLIHGEKKEHNMVGVTEQFDAYNKNCRLTLKAIELNALQIGNSDFSKIHKISAKTLRKSNWFNQKGVVGASPLRIRLQLPLDHPAHLSCVPINPEAIQAASLDIHLGHWFAVARRSKLKSLPLDGKFDEKLLSKIGRDEIFVPDGKTFLIHPGDLILGATLEFLALPNDLMAFVEGRSGTGRMGLFVATASKIAPGFHGVIVLELVNAGTIPLELKPGIPIAQLVFQTMTHKVNLKDLYKGKFYCQVKP